MGEQPAILLADIKVENFMKFRIVSLNTAMNAGTGDYMVRRRTKKGNVQNRHNNCLFC